MDLSRAMTSLYFPLSVGKQGLVDKIEVVDMIHSRYDNSRYDFSKARGTATATFSYANLENIIEVVLPRISFQNERPWQIGRPCKKFLSINIQHKP